MLIRESLSYHSDETMSFNGLVERERGGKKTKSHTEGKKQLSYVHTIARKFKYRLFHTLTILTIRSCDFIKQSGKQ